MDETERCIKEIKPLIYPMMMSSMAPALDVVRREFSVYELERKLGHSPTAWDIWYCELRQEQKRRAEAYAAWCGQALASWNNLMAQLQQMAEDKQKIDDFVWRQG